MGKHTRMKKEIYIEDRAYSNDPWIILHSFSKEPNLLRKPSQQETTSHVTQYTNFFENRWSKKAITDTCFTDKDRVVY